MNKKTIKKIQTSVILLVCASLLMMVGCKRDSIGNPSPVGPSTFAIVLEMSASPNTILAGDAREMSTITAKLRKYDGSAIANTSVQFQVQNSLGIRVNLGYFEGGASVKTKTTNGNGEITLVYYGPTVNEMIADSMIYILGVVGWEGDQYITESTPLYIVKDVNELDFEIYADPNVLWCTQQNPQSTIKAYFKKVDGAPMANRKVFFSILAGPGEFANGKTRTFAITDSNGFASAIYKGPKGSQIAYDQFVTIRGQPETSTPFYIHEEIEVRLIKGN